MTSIPQCPNLGTELPTCAASDDAFSLTPEYTLATHVVLQAWRDLRSPVPWCQRAAVAFFRDDEGMLAFWGQVLGCEQRVLAYAAILAARVPPPVPAQLPLFGEEGAYAPR